MAEYTMSSQFSKDCKYFAHLSIDGKLKIWETATSTFKQEFTPDLHLKTPCTCLHWIQGTTQSQWKKRKRRSSEPSASTDDSNHLIALGTTSGILLLYSVATAQIETTVDSNTSKSITCITWENTQDVFAGADENILQFNLKEKSIKTKWKAGTDKINSILLVPSKERLLTASKTIKLWDLSTREVVKIFTGHSSNVVLLKFIPSDNSDPYFLSGSMNDRLLNCWSLNEESRERNAVASLLMEDIAISATLVEGSDNTTNLAAVTRSGVVHVYQHTLNGKYGKPVKPKLTVQVASDTIQNKDLVTPIPIVAAYIHTDTTLMIAHGNYLILTFENVVPSSYEKVQCLIRKDPQEASNVKQNEAKKSKQAVLDKSVEYLTPHTTNNVRMKRKSGDAKVEVPMEQRLENLTLNKTNAGVPKQDNVAQLLVQGLHSKDKSILHQALSRTDEVTIRNTVKRLPMQAVIPLVTELSALIRGKTISSQIAVVWLKHVLQCHASQLLSNPELEELVLPILSIIENRLSLFTPLTRLKGRLDLLVSQISDHTLKDVQVDQALLVYKDQDSSESDAENNLELTLRSDSENEWVEEDSGNDSNADDLKVDENNVSDSEMSL